MEVRDRVEPSVWFVVGRHATRADIHDPGRRTRPEPCGVCWTDDRVSQHQQDGFLLVLLLFYLFFTYPGYYYSCVLDIYN